MMNGSSFKIRLSTIVSALIFTGIAFAQDDQKLFKLLPSSETGIDFNNQLFESDTLNILNQANIYNGGGVGIGDFNQDGLMDVYFAANMVSNKLYLNKGDLRFDDITETAKVTGDGRWCTGVSVVDINTDGWPDIYVSASFQSDPRLRTNLLYINQGADGNGIPIFKESAESYGLADNGFSTQAYFFDYDNDGDLDMYQVTNEIYDPRTPIRYRTKLIDGSALNTDRLYRNDGSSDGSEHPTFTDVSTESGITIEGWGHAAAISDFNADGWPDIYVANDFISNDLLYINNKDGSFTDRLDEYFKHTGWNAMGTDVVDIDNDGYADMISLEMLPENNLRKKRMLSGNEYYNYINNAQYNYNHQYVRNVMQMNSGPTPAGHPVFNDTGFMMGVYETDWSWCPLAADFDNDGFRDLIITNGLPRDVTDLDYIAYGSGQRAGAQEFTLAMTDSLPVVKLANYAFKNEGGKSFENTTQAWGMEQKSFSNGGVYADLDNDGDLDVVVNNINDIAFVYENMLQDLNRYVRVSLVGPDDNPDGLGAVLQIYKSGGLQYYEHYPTRGYLSTHDPRAHFGLGKAEGIDSLSVVWPDGKMQVLSDIMDRFLTINYRDADQNSSRLTKQSMENINRKTSSGTGPSSDQQLPTTRKTFATAIFEDASSEYGIDFKPVETDFSDYNIQPTIPHKLSQYGPGIAVGDIDGNGFEDFYLGGSSDNPGLFFMQDADGNFTEDASRFTQTEDILFEDMGVLLFDADNDNDLDLYLVSGSYEIPADHAISNDRFFMNDGEGMFTRSDALPKDLANGSCVKAADFDADGDLDLFVGGRAVSAAYPAPPKSMLLRNDSGKFTDVTADYCPELQRIGMVTDALWTDFDTDGKPDLLLAGEWMPITLLKNNGTSLVKIETGLEDSVGWWNSLISGDFDNDGDIDYVAGNLGLNSNYKATPEEPMTIIAKDIDENGSTDATVFCYMKGDDGIRKPYPIASRDDLVSQAIGMRKRFPSYKSYGLAGMDEVWSQIDRQDAMVLKATEMRTSYIENLGNGRFEMKPLPIETQKAPVYGMQTEDLNGDGHLDLVLVGNDYGMDPYSGRHDAFNGLTLQGDGDGNFKAMALQESGFFVPGDAKGLATLHTAQNEEVLIATQNQDSLAVFRKRNGQSAGPVKWIDLNPDDFAADVVYKDGRRRRVEFYYGSTFLSQSSRKFPVGKEIEKMTIVNFQGDEREAL